VRARCVELCRQARRDLCAVLDTEPIAPDEMVLQMASVRLPDGVGEALGGTLWEEHRIEIPIMHPQNLLRISIAAYTTRDDVERLLDALPRALART
jgi:selenocysteine lyase/cysteine desulfurase